jgi:hypothetical protein
MGFAPSSKTRLTEHDLGRFNGVTLFERVARAVCRAGCLPRKELYEAWEVGRRTRRLFRGGRIVDLAAGHGLLAHVMTILDATSPCALAVDQVAPPSYARLHDELAAEWPTLADRVTFAQIGLESIEIQPDDVVVSSHACGALTDVILDRAVAAGARVAVLPCCQDFETCDSGPLRGWVDRALAIDIMRAVRLERDGYEVWTQAIPATITPKNRLLLGRPRQDGSWLRTHGSSAARRHA